MGFYEGGPMGSQEGRHGVPRGGDEGPLAAQRVTAGPSVAREGFLGTQGGALGFPRGVHMGS